MRATVEGAVKKGLSQSMKGKKSGGDWTHLNDKLMPNLPDRTTVDIDQRNSEEIRFDEAIEGRDGVAGDRRGSDDLEMGGK